MARRCTVFSLPPQVFECIAIEMYLSDIFTLSTCSKRSFNLVKNTLLLIDCPDYETLFSLIIRMNSNSFLVDLIFRGSSAVAWYFNGKRNRERYDKEEKPTISVKMNSGQCNQKTIGFRELERGDYGVYGIASDSVQDLLQFTEHISTLFCASGKLLEINSGQAVHLESILSVPILKNCREVWIRDHRSGTISHDAMRRVLEGFHCKQVNFHCNIDRNFNLSLKYTCESLSLNTSQLTYQHVNVFLHQWIRSKYKKPVDLKIDVSTIRKEAERWGVYDDKCWQETENPETQEEKWNLKKIAEGLTRYVITYSKKHLNAILSVPILKKCPEVTIGNRWKGTISHDALRQVSGFEGKRVKLKCNIDRYFTLPFQYSCESLSLDTSQVTNEHVNAFLHQWIRSSCEKQVEMDIKECIYRKKYEQYGIYNHKYWTGPEDPEAQEEKWDLRKIAEGLSSYVITYLKNENVLVFQRETDGMELRLQAVYYHPGLRLYMYDNRKDHWTRRRPLTLIYGLCYG